MCTFTLRDMEDSNQENKSEKVLHKIILMSMRDVTIFIKHSIKRIIVNDCNAQGSRSITMLKDFVNTYLALEAFGLKLHFHFY